MQLSSGCISRDNSGVRLYCHAEKHCQLSLLPGARFVLLIPSDRIFIHADHRRRDDEIHLIYQASYGL